MDYKKIVSIVGKPGLYEIVNQRPDGLIAKPVEGGKTSFISSRLNQFTLLENISIYTQDDAEPLYDILQSMVDKLKDHPVPDKKASNDDLKKYFAEILPDYDKEKVYVSDIKKVIKWYNILNAVGLEELLKEKKEEDEKNKKEKEEGKKSDSKDKKTAKKSAKTNIKNTNTKPTRVNASKNVAKPQMVGKSKGKK